VVCGPLTIIQPGPKSNGLSPRTCVFEGMLPSECAARSSFESTGSTMGAQRTRRTLPVWKRGAAKVHSFRGSRRFSVRQAPARSVINVNDARLGIERWGSPPRPAVHAREARLCQGTIAFND